MVNGVFNAGKHLFHPLQMPPELVPLVFAIVFGFIAILCIGCVLMGHYRMTQGRIKKKAAQMGVPMPKVPSRGIGKYVIFFLIAFVLPGYLMTTPALSMLGMWILWYWVFLFVVVVPIVMILGHFSQMRDWEASLPQRQTMPTGDGSPPGDNMSSDYEN